MRLLLVLLLLKAVVLALIIGRGEIGLAPDEAQYWTWSQELDWGYYSKPPGIAWQIWLTSSLFGNNPLGVRFGALLISFLLSLVVYKGARYAGLEERSSFWAGVVAAFSPLGVYLSLVATTDGGAILFLTLAAILIIKGIKDEKGPHYPLIGFCILVGALYKWIAFLFWPLLFISLFFFKRLRKWSLLGGVAISLVALLPSLYWNMSHDWATFRHVATTVGAVRGGNPIDFLGSQIGLLSPIYFALLVLSYFYLKSEKNRGLCFAAGFPLFALIYLGAAFFKKIQPNWAAYLYAPGFILIAWIGCERLKNGRMWLSIGTWLSLLMVLLLFAIPWLQESGTVSLPYTLNPFRQLVGWKKLTPALLEAGYHPEENFLFADKYQTTSLLSFYGPKQKRAYFFNLSQTRNNQFSYWPPMEHNEKGKTGYFVVIENREEMALHWYIEHYQRILAPYFEAIHYRTAYPLFSVAGEPVKYAMIFECIHYSGASPPSTAKY